MVSVTMVKKSFWDTMVTVTMVKKNLGGTMVITMVITMVTMYCVEGFVINYSALGAALCNENLKLMHFLTWSESIKWESIGLVVFLIILA